MSTIQYRPSRRPTSSRSRGVGIAAAAIAVMVVVCAVAAFAHGQATASAAANSPANAIVASAKVKKAKSSSRKSSSRKRASKSTSVASAAGKSTSTAKAKKAASTRRTLASKKATARRVAVASGPSLASYRGLGSWVDLYDDKAWSDPGAAINSMSRHGVRTLYVETSNYHSSDPIMHQSELNTLIERAHSKGIRVVAWYLPDLRKGSVDWARVKAAIGYKTPKGQKFDSFALDIEASVVSSVSERNANLAALSKKIRGYAGKNYPLGGIIPSPVGLSHGGGDWADFPYRTVANYYDVIVPMAYYTYHTHGYSGVYDDATGNVKLLRKQPGCAHLPIHLIGGVSEDSSASEAQAFSKAVVDTHCFGGSLYGWPGTSAGEWKALKAIAR